MASALCRLPLRPALRRLAGKSPASKLWQSNKMGVWEQEFRNQLKRSTSFDLLIAKVRAGKYLNRNASESSGKASTAIARAHLQAVQNNMLPYLMQMSDCAQEAPNSVCVAAYDEVLRLLNKGNGVVQPYQLRNIIKAMKNVSNLRAQHRAQQASESSPHQLATAQKATVSSVGDPGLESAAVPSCRERTRSQRATTTSVGPISTSAPTMTGQGTPISPISIGEQAEQRSLIWREGSFVPVEDTATTPEPSNGQVSVFNSTPVAISEPSNETLDVSTSTSEPSNGQVSVSTSGTATIPEPSDKTVTSSTSTPDPSDGQVSTTTKPEPSDKTVSSSTSTPDPSDGQVSTTTKPEPSNKTASSFTSTPDPSDGQVSTATKPEPSNETASSSTSTPDPSDGQVSTAMKPEPSDETASSFTSTPDPSNGQVSTAMKPEPSDETASSSTSTPDPSNGQVSTATKPEPSDETVSASTSIPESSNEKASAPAKPTATQSTRSKARGMIGRFFGSN